MNLIQALQLRKQLRQPYLFDEYPQSHGIYIFYVFPESFNIALVGNELNGDTPEELFHVEEWVENEGFDYIRLEARPEYIDLDWTLVESYNRYHASAYSMIQRIATWAGYLDRYNMNPQHIAWPGEGKEEQLEVFFKAQ